MGAPVPVQLSPVGPEFEPYRSVARLGMIALSTDLTSERDAARLIPHDDAALHVTRVAHVNPSTPENLRKMAPKLTAAAEMLAPVPNLAAIYYSCTAASIEIGEEAVAQAINAACPDVPVVTPLAAAREGFAALGVRRIALVTPYLVETAEPIAAAFERRGLDVVSAHCLGIADDRDMARVTRATIIAAAEAADCAEVEGIFLSCTAMPALCALADLEERLGKPAISSNQAGIWRMLHHARLQLPPHAPGRLFGVTPLGAEQIGSPSLEGAAADC